MEIVGNMNILIKTKIQDENIEVPYKIPKIEMDVKPKIEIDFKAKSEPTDDVNRGMEIIIKAKIQTKTIENYKCSVCNLMEFSEKNLLMQHMGTAHKVHIENVFEKAHKSGSGPFSSETKSLSKLSTLEKVFHMIDCIICKIESSGEINKGNDAHASEDIGKYHCIFCSKKDIPSKKDLRRHLKFAHEKDIAKKTKCDNCNAKFLNFFGIGKNHLKISHIVDCYLCVETKMYCNSNQKNPVVKAKIKSGKHDCIICTKNNFPTNETLIEHMRSVHKRIVKNKKKCHFCLILFCGSKGVPRMTTSERISHLFNCYQKKGVGAKTAVF